MSMDLNDLKIKLETIKTSLITATELQKRKDLHPNLSAHHDGTERVSKVIDRALLYLQNSDSNTPTHGL